MSITGFAFNHFHSVFRLPGFIIFNFPLSIVYPLFSLPKHFGQSGQSCAERLLLFLPILTSVFKILESLALYVFIFLLSQTLEL